MSDEDPRRAVASAAIDAALDAELAKVPDAETSVDLPEPGEGEDPETVSRRLTDDVGVEVALTFDDPAYLAMIEAELTRLADHGLLLGLTAITDDPDRFDSPDSLKDRSAGLYNTETQELYVAPEDLIGETPREREARPGYFATDANFGSVWHELGHHRIRYENPGMDFEADEGEDYWGQHTLYRFAVEEIKGWDWAKSQDPASIRRAMGELDNVVSDAVSEYAMFGGMEYIAEVYSGLMAGTEYDERIMDLHARLSGPVPPESARNPGTAFVPEAAPEPAGSPATAPRPAVAVDAAVETAVATQTRIDDIRPGPGRAAAKTIVDHASDWANDITLTRVGSQTVVEFYPAGFPRPEEDYADNPSSLTVLDTRGDLQSGIFRYGHLPGVPFTDEQEAKGESILADMAVPDGLAGAEFSFGDFPEEMAAPRPHVELFGPAFHDGSGDVDWEEVMDFGREFGERLREAYDVDPDAAVEAQNTVTQTGVEYAGPKPDPAIQQFAEGLAAWGADRVSVFTNESTGTGTVDFDTPLPGDAPIRATVAFEGDTIEKATLRYGVLDPDAFEGHPSENRAQLRRLARAIIDVDPPDTLVHANFGDTHYPPRPHVMVGWGRPDPSVGPVTIEVHDGPPFAPLDPDVVLDYAMAVGEAIEAEFDDEYVGPDHTFAQTLPAANFGEAGAVLYRGASLDRMNADEFRDNTIDGHVVDVWHTDMPTRTRDATRDDTSISKWRTRDVEDALGEYIVDHEAVEITGGLTDAIGTAVNFQSPGPTDPGVMLYLDAEKIPGTLERVEYDPGYLDRHPGTLAHVDDLTVGEVFVNGRLWGTVGYNQQTDAHPINEWGEQARGKIDFDRFTDEREVLARTNEIDLDGATLAVASHYHMQKALGGALRATLNDLPGYSHSSFGRDVTGTQGMSDREVTAALWEEMAAMVQWPAENYWLVVRDDERLDRDADLVAREDFMWAYNGEHGFVEDYDAVGLLVGKDRTLAPAGGVAPRTTEPQAGKIRYITDHTSDGINPTLREVAESGDFGSIQVETMPPNGLGPWTAPGVPKAQSPHTPGGQIAEVRMPVEDFRRLQTHIGVDLGTSDSVDDFWAVAHPGDERVQELMDILTGEVEPDFGLDGLPMPWVQIGRHGNLMSDQEGRHRLVAAEALGMETIPVRIVYNAERVGADNIDAAAFNVLDPEEVPDEVNRLVRYAEQVSRTEVQVTGRKLAGGHMDYSVDFDTGGGGFASSVSVFHIEGADRAGVSGALLRLPVIPVDEWNAGRGAAAADAAAEIEGDVEAYVADQDPPEGMQYYTVEARGHQDDGPVPHVTFSPGPNVRADVGEYIAFLKRLLGGYEKRFPTSHPGDTSVTATMAAVPPEDQFDTKAGAEARADEIGCTGAHKMPDGNWMPCDTHDDYHDAKGIESLEAQAGDIAEAVKRAYTRAGFEDVTIEELGTSGTLVADFHVPDPLPSLEQRFIASSVHFDQDGETATFVLRLPSVSLSTVDRNDIHLAVERAIDAGDLREFSDAHFEAGTETANPHIERHPDAEDLPPARELAGRLSDATEAFYDHIEDATAPMREVGQVLAAIGDQQDADDLVFTHVDPVTFSQKVEDMIESDPEMGAFLTYHPPNELADHTLLQAADGEVGVAVSPAGDVQNVYNDDGPSGGGREAVQAAIAHGGCTLDCYDGFLRDLYYQYGFRETGRMAFDPEYAPEGWNLERFGHPDVVFMAYRPEVLIAGEADTYYDPSDWEQAKREARSAADCDRSS